MRHVTWLSLVCLSITAASCSRTVEVELPEAHDVKTISISIQFDGFKDNSFFEATPDDWKAIRANLRHATVESADTAWEGLGLIKLVKRDGEPYNVQIWDTWQREAAFSVGDGVEYHGGDTAELKRLLEAAYESAQRRKESEEPTPPAKAGGEFTR
jgi:hypothetical protein